MYLGLLGLAQDFETILQAARRLLSNPGIIFILMGEGPEKINVQKRRVQMSLENVQIFPEVRREFAPIYLSASDCAIVPLRHVDLFTGIVPTKMFDAWACERPVILGVEGEAKLILESCKGGVNYIPEDVDSLVDAITFLVEHPAESLAMGKRGRHHVEFRYNRLTQAQKLVELFENLVHKTNN
jgi:glycosyltransferase involved in cell wall biosynthesis